MKKYLRIALILVGLALITSIAINNYSFIFSRKVVGVIENIERVQVNVALLQTQQSSEKIPSELYSFAVAIKQPDGEIVTASAEDRQWAVATKGQCVEARYYPYPFWNLDKSGTYYGARLLRLSDCSNK